MAKDRTPDGAWALLLGSARQVRGRLTVLAVLMLTWAAVRLAGPALLATAVNDVLTGTGAGRAALLFAAALLGGAVLETLLAPLAAGGAARATRWLRMRSARHFLGLGARPPLPAGEAVTHLTQAAPQAGGLAVSLLAWAVSLVSAVGAFAALWLLDWRTGLTFTLAVPVAVLLAKVFLGRAMTAHDAYLAAQAGIATRLLTALSGARTIRASGTLAVESGRVLAPLPDVAAAGHRMWRLQRGVVWQLGLLLSLTEAAVLAVAGLAVVHGRLSPGQLLAVVGYLAIAFQGLERIDGLYSLAMARAAARRLAGPLAVPAIPYGDRSLPPGPGVLDLRGVTVHAGGRTVLDRLDLRLPAGRAVALVGRTGTGKSLLAGLPGRLTEPEEGVVLLDGVPVRELGRAELRSAVTYAFERPELIGESVGDTIAYGHLEPSAAAIRAAARAAHADRFVRLLPDGYETPLAHAPMSGGERQRLGLARTLTRDARVYVLDDATSGLDTVTEAEVSEAVTTALAGRTRLVVAHRVATAARCDLVAWLDQGRIRALAPHAELWHHPGYRAVFGIAAETAPDTITADTTPDAGTPDRPARVGGGEAAGEEAAECPVR
jgi:ATP-binding cassette subfamily B protein